MAGGGQELSGAGERNAGRQQPIGYPACAGLAVAAGWKSSKIRAIREVLITIKRKIPRGRTRDFNASSLIGG